MQLVFIYIFTLGRWREDGDVVLFSAWHPWMRTMQINPRIGSTMQVILSAYEGTIDLPSDDGDDGDGDNGLHWPAVCSDDASGTQRGVSILPVAEKDAVGQQNKSPKNTAQVFPFPHPSAEHPPGASAV